jgi:hypothetical protein
MAGGRGVEYSSVWEDDIDDLECGYGHGIKKQMRSKGIKIIILNTILCPFN